MINNFTNMIGKIAPNMCRISLDGSIAVKTSHGYRTYNVNTGKAVNCEGFAFDPGFEMFFLLPTTTAHVGDIILVDGKPHCVKSIGEDNIITAYRYEDSNLVTIVPETYTLFGDVFVYSKVVSLFGNNSTKFGKNKLMKAMVLSQMFSGGGATSGASALGNMNPMMLMMMMGGSGSDMFSGLFDGIMNSDDDEGDNKKEEDK